MLGFLDTDTHSHLPLVVLSIFPVVLSHPLIAMTKPRAMLAVRLADGTQFFANDRCAAQLLIDQFGKACMSQSLPSASVTSTSIGLEAAMDEPSDISISSDPQSGVKVAIASPHHHEILEKLDAMSGKLELATAGLIAIGNHELAVLSSGTPHHEVSNASQEMSHGRTMQTIRSDLGRVMNDNNHEADDCHAFFVGDYGCDASSQTAFSVLDGSTQTVTPPNDCERQCIELQMPLVQIQQVYEDKISHLKAMHETSFSEVVSQLDGMTSLVSALEKTKAKRRK